jgi:hypothetical protein
MNCQICIAIITLRTLCFVFLLNLSYTQRLQSSFACSQINKNEIAVKIAEKTAPQIAAKIARVNGP